ncbi:MAG: DNA polymerase III subunit delta' [Proteobacteria bacterium]|nr:DNA polymerase III subunit delta' [Pseudomonadota bacterium]MDA1355741.1 DNA polymerase III subunit delta' [Pseudomonadota bacterium]
MADDLNAISPPAPFPPRDNSVLCGHQHAVKTLFEAWRAGKLQHAWLLSGPRGIGKATLAYQFARFVLAGGPQGSGESGPLFIAPDHPIFRRVASGGHTDFMTIERSTNEKTGKKRSEIVVDDVRRVGRLVSLTPGEGLWRVVIVDGAEDMNRNAANAILKYLEEPPPQTLFLLVSHAPARLLPTVRSRCRSLTMRPLTDAMVSDLIAMQIAPGLGAQEREILTSISEGSPGRALALAEQGGVELYEKLIGILSGLPDLDIRAVHSLGDRVARNDGAEAFHTVSGLLVWWLNHLICDGAKSTQRRGISEREDALRRRLLAKGDLEHWAAVWEKLSRLFARAEAVNLDRKHVILNAFTALQQAAGD